MMNWKANVTAALLAALAVPALADGDAAKGAKVFKKCAACHTAVVTGSHPTRAFPTSHGPGWRCVRALPESHRRVSTAA